MGKLSILKYFILLNIFNLHLINNELIFVYEHSRHGIRGSITLNQSLIKNGTFYDEYHSNWKGNGELTLKGKMQQYILGIRNRLRYPNLINYNNFSSEELLIHATNTSRAQESAYNQLLGMFKPFFKLSEKEPLIEKTKESNRFYYPNNYIFWNKHSNSIYKKIINEAELSIKLLESMNNNSESENFLTEGIFNLEENNKKYNLFLKLTPYSDNATFFIIFNCKNNEKYVKYKYEDKFIDIIKENLEKNYGNKLQSFFGYENKEWLYNIKKVVFNIDNFISNYHSERDLKDFVEITGIDREDYYQKCMNIYNWWIYHLYCDKKTSILESEKMMKDLIEHMDNKINNAKNKLKMVIDLGHDFTLAPMELFMHEAFGVKYSTTFFSSNVFFELNKEKNNNKDIYFVNYYIDDELLLNIDYELFKKKVIKKFWTEKEKDEFCNGNIIRILYPKTFIFCILLILIIIGILVLILYRCYSKNKKKYSKKNDEIGKELELI